MELVFTICAWYTLILQGLALLARIFGDDPPKKRFTEIMLQLPTVIFIIMYFTKQYQN